MYDVVEQKCSSCGVLFLDLALHVCVCLSSSVLTCARSEHLTRDLQHMILATPSCLAHKSAPQQHHIHMVAEHGDSGKA